MNVNLLTIQLIELHLVERFGDDMITVKCWNQCNNLSFIEWFAVFNDVLNFNQLIIILGVNINNPGLVLITGSGLTTS